MSTLYIVDLAGSEAAAAAGDPRRAGEGAAINASLFALRSVFEARAANAYVPFRNATLTKVLREALGATSKLLVLATVSQDPRQQAESMATLAFARQAREVVTTPTVNAAADDLPALKRVISALRARNAEVERELRVPWHIRMSADVTIARGQSTATSAATAWHDATAATHGPADTTVPPGRACPLVCRGFWVATSGTTATLPVSVPLPAPS